MLENKVKIDQLQAMPGANPREIVYGIDGQALVLLLANGSSLDLSSLSYGSPLGILTVGAKAILRPQFRPFVSGVPHPVDEATTLAIMTSGTEAQKHALLIDVANTLSTQKRETVRGTFDEFLHLAQDASDLAKSILSMHVRGHGTHATQVTQIAKINGPSPLRPIIRTLFDWFEPFCRTVSIKDDRFTANHTPFQIRPRTLANSHQVMEAAQRMQGFLARAAADLQLSDERIKQINARFGF